MLVKILVTVTIFAGIILFEVPSLAEDNHRRELVIFFILLFPSLVITILEAIGAEIPQLDASVGRIAAAGDFLAGSLIMNKDWLSQAID